MIVYPDSEITDGDPNIGNAAVADRKAFHVLTHIYDGSNRFMSRNELDICVHFMLWGVVREVTYWKLGDKFSLGNKVSTVYKGSKVLT